MDCLRDNVSTLLLNKSLLIIEENKSSSPLLSMLGISHGVMAISSRCFYIQPPS